MRLTKVRSLLTAVASMTLLAGAGWAGEIQGKVTASGIRSPENIVVYIDAIPGKEFPAPAQHAVMDQKSLKFVPHVMVVLKGTTVDFLNSDNVGHNVFWPSVGGNKKLGHNLGTWPKGEKKSFKFDQPGVVALLCNVHPEMSGYVIVVPTPYFAVTDKEGHYEINGVPPASYTLRTWSEEGKPATQAVTATNTTVTADLTVRR